MKNLSLFIWLCQTAAALFCGAALFASDDNLSRVESQPLFDWSLLWSGSWEEGAHRADFFEAPAGTLQNRGEMKLIFLPLDLTLRAQALDRLKVDFGLEPPWGDPGSRVTNFTGGLYHKPTGSRLLYGVLDEWGLSARIRNPWIRSPPYAENHKPVIADLKTSPNSTKEDEIYLYLSTPFIDLFPNVKLRGFVSAQNDLDPDQSPVFAPAVSAGADFSLPEKTNLMIETFIFGKTLPPLKPSTWFSAQPPLPEREFSLFAGAFLFTCPDFSVSSDFAVSETFAWGTDIYANLGASFSPLLPFGDRERPLLISIAADGSGERFVNRDGANLKEGFRSAAKIEWKSKYSSLLRFNTVLRSSGFGDEFNRGSTDFYYRFPSSARDARFVRLTRISFSADRNSENPLKVSDGYSAFIGVNINPRPIGINSNFGLNFSGSLKGLSMSDNINLIFPIPDDSWEWQSASAGCEFIWTPYFQKKPGAFQVRAKIGCDFFPEKDDMWEVSVYSSIRFKNGRLSFKVFSPDFPEKWRWTVSWRLNIQNF